MKIATPTLVLLFLAGALAAQEMAPRQFGRRAQMNYSELQTALSMTDDQLQNLLDAQRTLRESLRPEMEELSSLMRDLRQAMQADAADETLVNQLRETIAQKREAVSARQAEAREAARSFLTNDQLDMLLTLEEEIASRQGLSAAARQAIALNLIGGTESLGRRFGRGMDRGLGSSAPRRGPRPKRPPVP